MGGITKQGSLFPELTTVNFKSPYKWTYTVQTHVVQGSMVLPSGLRPANEPDLGLWGPKHAPVHIPHTLTPPFMLRQRMR